MYLTTKIAHPRCEYLKKKKNYVAQSVSLGVWMWGRMGCIQASAQQSSSRLKSGWNSVSSVKMITAHCRLVAHFKSTQVSKMTRAFC